MKLSEAPPFPLEFSLVPVYGCSSRFFEDVSRPGRWIVSPTPSIWVVFLKGTKQATGWVDLTDPEPRRLRDFEREDANSGG